MNLPDIQIFDYIEKGEFFVLTKEYKYIADMLELREWNEVVWIGRLFCMDNDYGEHWMDNWGLRGEMVSIAKEQGFSYDTIFVVDPRRFKDNMDGPCNIPSFRKRFWMDVLRNLKINLGTLFEKARADYEHKKAREDSSSTIENLEDIIREITKKYHPDSS